MPPDRSGRMHDGPRPVSPVPFQPFSGTDRGRPASPSSSQGGGSRSPTASRPRTADRSMNLSVRWGADTLVDTSHSASSSKRSSPAAGDTQRGTQSISQRPESPNAAMLGGSQGIESGMGEEGLDWTSGIGRVSSRLAINQDTLREARGPPTPTDLNSAQPLHNQPTSKAYKEVVASAAVEEWPVAETVTLPWTPPTPEDKQSSTGNTMRSPFNDSGQLLTIMDGDGGGQAEVWRPSDDPPEDVMQLMRLSQLLSSLTLPTTEGERRATPEDKGGGGAPCTLLYAVRTRNDVSSAFKVLQATFAPPPLLKPKPGKAKPASGPPAVERYGSREPLVSKAATELQRRLRPYGQRRLLASEMTSLRLQQAGPSALLRGLPMSLSVLAAIRRSKGRGISRSKTFYQQWAAVVRYELLVHYWPMRCKGRSTRNHHLPIESHDNCHSDTPGALIRKCFASSVVYGLALRNHSLGLERLSGSKAFLYKATVHQLRETEDLLAAFKRDFLLLRRTRTCRGRTHRTDTICATCSLIRKGNREMFKTALQSGADAMYPVAYLHDFFRAEMERLRQKVVKISTKLSKYEAQLFPVAPQAERHCPPLSTQAIKHFLCKHLTRMLASRAEASSLRSTEAFHARRRRLMTSLILGEQLDIRTVYKRFPDLSRELELFVVEESTRRKRRWQQAAATIQQAFRRHQKRKFRRQQAAEALLREKRARRVAKEVERKKEAMQKFAVNVMGRYKKIRSLNIWACGRESCKGRVWHDEDFFQVHELLHHRRDFRACAKKAALEGLKRRGKRAYAREIKFVHEALRKRREREEQRLRELQESAEAIGRAPPSPLIPSDYSDLQSLPVIPAVEVTEAVTATWQQQRAHRHVPLSDMSDMIKEVPSGISASEVAQYMQQQHEVRLHTGCKTATPKVGRSTTPFQRLYPDHSLQAKHAPRHRDGSPKADERVPVGASSRCVGPDRRACPSLILVSTMARLEQPEPFVVELKRRKTVIIGTGARAGVRLTFLLPEELQGLPGDTWRQSSACHVDNEHIIISATWTGSAWEVTVKDNHSRTGTYLLNAKGLLRVSSFGHTHLHDSDYLLLGRSELPDGSCGYDAIFQFHSPLAPFDHMPSSLRPPLPRLLKPYDQVQRERKQRKAHIREDLI